MLEFEKKIMLRPKEYKFLINHFSNISDINVQNNYYYDTDMYDMNELGITCRIREKNGKYISTIKAHQPDYKDCSIEISKTVKGLDDKSLFEGLDLKYQGRLRTTRHKIKTLPGVEIAIDRNTYLGKVDYELEIEYKVGEEKKAFVQLDIIGDILAEHDFVGSSYQIRKRTDSCISKGERFFIRKNKLKKRSDSY